MRLASSQKEEEEEVSREAGSGREAAPAPPEPGLAPSQKE
jgi:hypothetical protein